METKLINTREPNVEEQGKGAEVVFEREDSNGNMWTIYARECYESWEQWGAYEWVLSTNVDTVEHWRRNKY